MSLRAHDAASSAISTSEGGAIFPMKLLRRERILPEDEILKRASSALFRSCFGGRRGLAKAKGFHQLSSEREARKWWGGRGGPRQPGGSPGLGSGPS